MRQKPREEGHVKTQAEIRMLLPQAKDAWSHQKLEKARKDSPLKSLEGAWPCQHLYL